MKVSHLFFFTKETCKVRVDKLTAVGAVEVTSLETLGVVAETIAWPRKYITKGTITMCKEPPW